MIRMITQNGCFNEKIDDGIQYIQYLDKPAHIGFIRTLETQILFRKSCSLLRISRYRNSGVSPLFKQRHIYVGGTQCTAIPVFLSFSGNLWEPIPRTKGPTISIE